MQLYSLLGNTVNVFLLRKIEINMTENARKES